MTKNERLQAVIDAFETSKKDNGDEYETVSSTIPEEAQKAVRDIVFEIDQEGADFETAYEIVSRACTEIMDNEGAIEESEAKDEIEGFEEWGDNSASVYTETRLGYLNMYNQDDITSKVKDFGCAIQEACAYWYDEKARLAIDRLMRYIYAENA